MVERLWKKMTGPVEGLHAAAYLIGGLTLASQILALLRDSMFAHLFGAGQVLDAYYAAFRIPDVVFALSASLISAYVLIPRLSKLGKAEAQNLLSHATSFLLIGAGLISAIIAVFAPYILGWLFPHIVASSEGASFILLSRLLLIQPVLLGLSGAFASVTQIEKRFFLFSLSPIFYNLGIIFGAVFGYPLFGLMGIGYGVLLGAVLHILVNVPVLLHAGLFPRLVIPSWRITWSVVKDSLPRSLALGSGSVVTLFLAILASRVGAGGVSALALAGNLQAVPLSLLGAAYATAAFPVLALQYAEKNKEAFLETLGSAARHLVIWSSIAMVFFVVFRAHIVRLVLGSGAFNWSDTRLVAAVLAVLSFALVAQGFVLLASRAFYAANRSWMPFWIQVLGAALSISLASALLWLSQVYPPLLYFFETLFRLDGVTGSSVVVIAFGASLGQCVMALLAVVALSREYPGFSGVVLHPFLQGMGAAILGGTTSYFIFAYLGGIAPLTTFAAVFTQSVVAGSVGLGVTVMVLVLLGNRELKEILKVRLPKQLSKIPSFDTSHYDGTDS